MAEQEEGVLDLARAQHGVWSDEQVRRLKISRRVIQRRVEAGRWTRLAPGVLGYPSHAPSWRRSLMIGLLGLGPGAAVGGRSAAALHGFDTFAPGPLEFVVPENQRARREGLVVRRSCFVPEVDVIEVDGFAVTTATRTIIDLAGFATRGKVAVAIESALRDRRTSEALLRERLADVRRRGRAGPPMLDEILAERPAGEPGHSWLERRFLDLVDEAHLPRPAVQRTFKRGGTVIARVDFCWAEQRIIIEVNGYRWHSTKEQLIRDDRRRNELQLLGFVVYPFWYDDIANEPWRVLTVLRRLLLPA
jgi:hypothetical protein